MKTSELVDIIKKLDQSKDIIVKNNFDYDIGFSDLDIISSEQDKNIIKLRPYTILLDIGAFCLLKNKENILDQILTEISKMLRNVSNISKDDMIQQLKTICTIKVENVEECMPDMI